MRAKKQSSSKKKRNAVFPGPHVGGSTPHDDNLPLQRHIRGETIKANFRGRTEPRRGPTPPKHHGPKG
jgi:hypothetical protein